MTIQLPPEIEQYVAEKVTQGEYASASEFVTECVVRQRMEDGFDIAQLRQLVAEADDDVVHGRLSPFDPQATVAAAFAQLDAERDQGE